jgi:hypothetical protein
MLVAIRRASLCVSSFDEAERRAGQRTEIFAFGSPWRSSASGARIPRRRCAGSTTFVNGTVFSFKEQPSTLGIDNPKLTPWVGVDRIRREGGIIVCPETDAFCMRALRGYTTYYSVVADENAMVSRRLFRHRVGTCALRDHHDSSGAVAGYAQRHGAGTLTLHLRWSSIVRLASRASGEVGVF